MTHTEDFPKQVIDYIDKLWDKVCEPSLVEKIFITKEIVLKKGTIHRKYDDTQNITI